MVVMSASSFARISSGTSNRHFAESHTTPKCTKRIASLCLHFSTDTKHPVPLKTQSARCTAARAASACCWRFP